MNKQETRVAEKASKQVRLCGRCAGDRNRPREMRDHMDSCHEAANGR